MRTAILAALMGTALTALSGPASAQSCGEQARQMAAALGGDADPPVAAAPQAGTGLGGSGSTLSPVPGDGGATSSSRLARSGGVIQPPDEGRTPVIQPPRTGDDMTVTPALPPQTGDGSGRSAGRSQPGRQSDDTEAAAARRAQVQSLLTAAREASDRGNENECLERLAEARARAGR